MKFFYSPNSCALASHIALEEAGAVYEPVRLNFAANEQRGPEYLKVNPKGRVPALATERGVLTETPAMLLYIAQTHPKANLAPTDPWQLAELQAFNSYLCSTVHVAHSHGRRGTRWVDDAAAIEAMKRKVPQTMGDCFDLIERSMFKGPWVFGETYTIADPYLFTVAQWLEGDGVDPARFPRLEEHRRRVGERPAVKKAIAIETA